MSVKNNHHNNNSEDLPPKITEEISAALQYIGTENLVKSANLMSSDLHSENLPTSLTKDDLIPYLEENVLSYGISTFIEGLHNNINNVCNECGLEVYNSDKLKEFIKNQGILQFLRTYHSPGLFKIYTSALNLNEDQEPSVSGLEEILDEIVLQGMQYWLNKFPKSLLEAWSSDLSVQYTHRSDLVDRIMTKIFSLQQLEDDVNLSIIPVTSTQNEDNTTNNTNTHKKEKKSSRMRHDSSSRSSSKKKYKRKLEDGSNESKKEKSIKKRKSKESSDLDSEETTTKHDRHGYKKRRDEDSESRKSKSPRKRSASISQIKPGISSSELSRFKREELVDYCRENNVTTTGNKESIVKHILHYLKESDSDSEDQKSKEREKSHTKKK